MDWLRKAGTGKFRLFTPSGRSLAKRGRSPMTSEANERRYCYHGFTLNRDQRRSSRMFLVLFKARVLCPASSKGSTLRYLRLHGTPHLSHTFVWRFGYSVKTRSNDVGFTGTIVIQRHRSRRIENRFDCHNIGSMNVWSYSAYGRCNKTPRCSTCTDTIHQPFLLISFTRVTVALKLSLNNFLHRSLLSRFRFMPALS